MTTFDAAARHFRIRPISGVPGISVSSVPQATHATISSLEADSIDCARRYELHFRGSISGSTLFRVSYHHGTAKYLTLWMLRRALSARVP